MEFYSTKEIQNPVNSYTVELFTDLTPYPSLIMGPFDKEIHKANLESLIETCIRMRKLPLSEIKANEYNSVIGFHQWFGVTYSMDILKTYYKSVYARADEAEHEKLFRLSAGFNQRPFPYYVKERSVVLTGYKVFYYDKTGKKFDVAIDWKELES